MVFVHSSIKQTGTKIKAGQEVHFPIVALHRDPKLYPDPLTYNPENFSKEAKAARNPYAFIAFGQGPRNCIGMRFALLEIKIALVHLLRSYSFKKCDRTPAKLTRDPNNLLGNPLEPIIVKVVDRREE